MSSVFCLLVADVALKAEVHVLLVNVLSQGILQTRLMLFCWEGERSLFCGLHVTAAHTLGVSWEERILGFLIVFPPLNREPSIAFLSVPLVVILGGIILNELKLCHSTLWLNHVDLAESRQLSKALSIRTAVLTHLLPC